MNKKGFTLTELLAVIVVLAIVMTIGIRSVYSINHAARVKLLRTKIEEIETAAINYGQENTKTVFTNPATDGSCNLKYKNNKGDYVVDDTIKFCNQIQVKTLVNGEKMYFKTEEKAKDGTKTVTNPVNNTSLMEDYIFIYKKNNRVYAYYIGEKNGNNLANPRDKYYIIDNS